MRYEAEVTNIENKTLNEKPSVYPCPAKEWLTIDFSTVSEKSIFEIYNLNGQVVLTGNNNVTKKKSVNIEGWPGGIYILKTWDKQKEKFYSNKIIIN
jgi:hypothetical protein